MGAIELHSHDMYGHQIWPLGETGFGVSVAYYRTNEDDTLRPDFTFFHVSDGFRQSLFNIHGTLDKGGRPMVSNIFHDRVAEVRQHALEALGLLV